MPNWVSCDLKVMGGKAELEKFKAFAKSKNELIDFNKFIPYPKKYIIQDNLSRKRDKMIRDMRDEISKNKKLGEFEKEKIISMISANYPYITDGYNQGGYDWCVENWGTKWNVYGVILDDKEIYNQYPEIFYTFQTAWSSPNPIILAMSKMFKGLTFELRYFEGANQFNGLFICEKGLVIDNRIGDYFGERGG